VARLVTCGFEIGFAAGSPEATLEATVSGTDPSRDTSVFRSGVASVKFDTSVAATQVVNPLKQAAALGTSVIYAASQTSFTRCYFRFDTTPTSNTEIMGVAGIRSGTQGVSVILKTTGVLALQNNVTGAQIGSDSAAVALDGSVWYRVEVKIIRNASNQITDVELRLEGTTVATSSGLTLASTTTLSVGHITSPGSSKVMYSDDCAVNDSTGTSNTSWPGDGKIYLLIPISDNARVGWTNAAAGTTNLFNDVDNTHPLGVASPTTQPSQIKRSAANTTDTYDANLTSYTTAGIASGDTLNAICILGDHAYSAAAVASCGFQMLSNPVISEFTTSTDGSAASTSGFHWAGGGKTVDYSGTVGSNVTVGTSPVLRVRKNTSSSSRTQYCDFMGALVDYTPAVVAATYQPRHGFVNAGATAVLMERARGAWHRRRSGIFVPDLWLPNPVG